MLLRLHKKSGEYRLHTNAHPRCATTNLTVAAHTRAFLSGVDAAVSSGHGIAPASARLPRNQTNVHTIHMKKLCAGGDQTVPGRQFSDAASLNSASARAVSSATRRCQRSFSMRALARAALSSTASIPDASSAAASSAECSLSASNAERARACADGSLQSTAMLYPIRGPIAVESGQSGAAEMNSRACEQVTLPLKRRQAVQHLLFFARSLAMEVGK